MPLRLADADHAVHVDALHRHFLDRDHVGALSSSRAASIICARQPRSCFTSTSGSSSANGSLPTSSRAHQTAWPSPSGSCWRVKLAVPGARQVLREQLEVGAPLAVAQGQLQLELAVEMVLDHALVAPGDEDEMLDAGLARLVDDMLDQRPVDDRQHLLRHGFGGRQEARSETGDGENGFANRFHDAGRFIRRRRHVRARRML